MLLDSNQMIDIMIEDIESVDGDIIENVGVSFGTLFDPLLSTPNRIRALAGSYLTDVPDDILLYLIHSYSLEAFFIVGHHNLIEPLPMTREFCGSNL